METKFKIYYDDMPNDVVDTISSSLEKFGLTIEMGDGGDGWIEYTIVKIKTDE